MHLLAIIVARIRLSNTPRRRRQRASLFIGLDVLHCLLCCERWRSMGVKYMYKCPLINPCDNSFNCIKMKVLNQGRMKIHCPHLQQPPRPNNPTEGLLLLLSNLVHQTLSRAQHNSTHLAPHKHNQQQINTPPTKLRTPKTPSNESLAAWW